MSKREKSRSLGRYSMALREAASVRGIDLSQPQPDGLIESLRAELSEQWLNENREAIESTNAWVEANGLPLAKYRLF